MCGCLSHTPYWGPGRNPDMCPDWESNWQPFGLQASTQSTDPHQPGLLGVFNMPLKPKRVLLQICFIH